MSRKLHLGEACVVRSYVGRDFVCSTELGFASLTLHGTAVANNTISKYGAQ